MCAHYGGSGLDVTLTLDDKEKVLAGNKTLVCQMQEWEKALVVLHVRKRIPDRWRVYGEEPGFHVTGKPKGAGLETRERYDIYLSKKRFDDLTNPPSPITEEGYFGTRSQFDRVDIKYFGVPYRGPKPIITRKI